MKMNKKKVYGAFLAMTFCLFGSVFVACDNDDDNPYSGKPVSVTEVRGEYANATINAGNADTTVTVVVGADSITISDFPIDGIVAAILPESEVAEALASIGNVPFSAGYNATVIGNNVVMSVSPDSLLFNMTAAGQAHNVKVGFTSGTSATYSSRDSTLSMKLEAKTVICDGDTIDTFSPIIYNVSSARKSDATDESDSNNSQE